MALTYENFCQDGFNLIDLHGSGKIVFADFCEVCLIEVVYLSIYIEVVYLSIYLSMRLGMPFAHVSHRRHCRFLRGVSPLYASNYYHVV